MSEEQVFVRMQGDADEVASHCAGWWPEGPCWALSTGRRTSTISGLDLPACADCATRALWTEADWLLGRMVG